MLSVEPPVAQTVTDIYTNGADNASRLVASLPLGNNDSSYVLTVVWFIAVSGIPYLHYEWTDLVYNAREKLLCYLQEITKPSNTTVYIVFGWCILGVDILFTPCKGTHWTDLYIRTGLHAREYSSIT